MTEIITRVPVLSLARLKFVSKRCKSLVMDSIVSTSLRQKHLDSAMGLYLKSGSVFVSFDSEKLKWDIAPNHDFYKSNRYKIVDSCNGLLLCRGVNPDEDSDDLFTKDSDWEDVFYVYNPSTWKGICLPAFNQDRQSLARHCMKLAFDPRKSPHYKVVVAGDRFEEFELYSSEKGSWSSFICEVLPESWSSWEGHMNFGLGSYCNDAIHWLDDQRRPRHLKLDLLNNKPMITQIQLPVVVEVNQSRKLFESRGCLLYLAEVADNANRFHIYELNTVRSEWYLRYDLSLDGTPILRSQMTGLTGFGATVLCVVLGDKDTDLSIVMELNGKIVDFKVLSKSIRVLHDGGGWEDEECFQFIGSLAAVSLPITRSLGGEGVQI